MWILALALAAPLDDDAIQALLARDGLLRAPHEEACCGEGSIGLSKVRWAELDGTAPEELVLTLQEYVGEGCATDHHHVYDVSGAEPRALGVLSHGGYMVFPYLEVTDLDGDGIDELFAVGPRTEATPSTFVLHGLVDGVLAPISETATQGQVYLPFDVDHDGQQEIVALRMQEDVVAVEVVGRDGRPAAAPPVARWLPPLFEATLARDEAALHRPEHTLELLAGAMRARGLEPPHPDHAFALVVDQVAGGANPDAYVAQTWWAGPSPQRARLEQLLDDPERAAAAARLLLRTPGPRDAALAWLHGGLSATAAGTERMPRDGTFEALTPAERQAVCTHVQQLVLGDGPETGRGDLAFQALAGPLWCVEATTVVLATEGLPRQVVRGAIHAVDTSPFDPDALEAFQARAPTVSPPLLALLEGDDPGLAAEAARALRHVGDHGDALRRTLMTTFDAEVQRSVLVALDALEDPGPARVYLAVLGRPTTGEVRRRLHGQLARMADPADVARGLAQVRSRTDYDAYQWRAVYRPASLDDLQRAVFRTDAAARLGDEAPRIRQSAAQILGALGVGEHRGALQAVAEGDGEAYVRDAAAEALE
jgi:hypothetical protein